MKRALLLGLLASTTALGLSGCGLVKDEFGYAGGAIGREESRFLPAETQTSRAARLGVELMVVANLAADSVTTTTEAAAAQAFITRIYSDVAAAEGAATGDCPNLLGGGTMPFASSCTAESPTALAFETVASQAERHLFGLVKLSLGGDQLSAFVDDLESFFPLAILDLLGDLISAFSVTDEVAATYRDAVVLLAHAVATAPSCQTPSAAQAAACQDLTALLAGHQQTTVGTASDRVIDGRTIAAMHRLALSLIKDPSFGWDLQPGHAQAIVYHVDRSCARLARIAQSDQPGCGPAASGQAENTARAAFLAAFKGKP
jgi:hypothetical protein